jgi:ADP-ribose pyrophosphatase YjhB (NUDIX family)
MLIYRSRVFDLYTSSVNARQFPLEYVGHKGSCAALVINASDEIGLIPHHRPAIGRTLFELPTATLDLQKTAEDTIKHELQKETGLQVQAGQLQRLTSAFSSPGHTTEAVTLFLVRLKPQQAMRTDSLRWFAHKELENLVRKEELVDLKTIAAIGSYKIWQPHPERAAS